MGTRQIIFYSLDIDFIHGHIHGMSCTQTIYHTGSQGNNPVHYSRQIGGVTLYDVPVACGTKTVLLVRRWHIPLDDNIQVPLGNSFIYKKTHFLRKLACV